MSLVQKSRAKPFPTLLSSAGFVVIGSGRRLGLWVANWQLWHKSPLWCSLAQIGRVSRRDCTSGFSQNSA